MIIIFTLDKKNVGIKPETIVDNEKFQVVELLPMHLINTLQPSSKNVTDNVAAGLEIKELPKFAEFLIQSNKSNIFLEDCSITELTDNINCLQNNKASDIPINNVKKSAPIIIPIFVDSINHCIKRGIFSDTQTR